MSADLFFFANFLAVISEHVSVRRRCAAFADGVQRGLHRKKASRREATRFLEIVVTVTPTAKTGVSLRVITGAGISCLKHHGAGSRANFRQRHLKLIYTAASAGKWISSPHTGRNHMISLEPAYWGMLPNVVTIRKCDVLKLRSRFWENMGVVYREA